MLICYRNDSDEDMSDNDFDDNFNANDSDGNYDDSIEEFEVRLTVFRTYSL